MSPGILVIDANQAGNDNYSAAPQAQQTIIVNAPAPLPVPPSPLWTWAEGVAAALIVGIILWLIFQKKPPDPLPPPGPTNPQAPQQSFRYVANEGPASHQIKFRQPSRSLGSIQLTPGMGQAEHTIEFPGRAGISRPGETS
jgi:hypothetical protein